MGDTDRSLGERTQEHDKSMKEGDSKSALSQHQVMTGYKVLNTPMIEGVRVIDCDTRNLHRKVKEAILSSFEEPPSTDQEGRMYRGVGRE